MRKSYVLIYSARDLTHEEVKAWADASPLVITWRYEMPKCIFLVSEKSAQELGKDFEKKFPPPGRYLITEVPSNCQGRLTTEGWYFLDRKKAKPTT